MFSTPQKLHNIYTKHIYAINTQYVCMRGRFNITLSQLLDEQLDHYAMEHDMTRSAVIESALKEFFKGAQDTQNIHINEVNNDVSQLAERMKAIEETLTQLVYNQKNQHNTNLDDIDTSQPAIMDNINSVAIIDNEKWYRHSEVVQMMPSSIKVNTRKSMVSRAVSKGVLATNGKRGTDCLIQGSSFIKWLNHIIA